MSDESQGEDSAGGVEGWVTRIRADDRRRWTAFVVGALVGLLVAWVHWIGLVVGGALVSLPARDGKRGVAAALAFGVFALVAFVLVTPTASVGELLALRPPILVTLGAVVVLPLLGSLARGVV